ncbi:MAG: flagellar basal body P-ring formation protein FlgA [Phycisphaerales bacterium]|nr:flagellar basal body P-ring formation protein FlgA [Phycisphaerales bacterium]
MIRTIRPLITIVLLGAVVAPAGADDIRLRAAVRVDADRTDIRLRDVAELDGDAAAALGDVVVATLTQPEPLVVPVGAVRTRLEAAGAHWGLVNLSGAKVIIRPRRVIDPSRGGAMRELAVPDAAPILATAEAAIARVAPPPGAAALLDRVTRLLAGDLNRDVADVRVDIDPEDLNRVALVADGADVQLQRLNAPDADRVSLQVFVTRGTETIASEIVRVRPTVHVAVTTLRVPAERGRIIGPSDVESADAWMSPGDAASMVDLRTALGRETTRALERGETLTSRTLRPSFVVKRGDVVRIVKILGPLRIERSAVARSDGAVGDSIDVRHERSTLRVLITGPGEATIP